MKIVSCAICDVSSYRYWQIRVREYSDKDKVFFYGYACSCYKYVCEKCYGMASKLELVTEPGGFALPSTIFERLKAENELPEIKEPAE